MELFERIRQVAKEIGSQAKLAETLGLPQPTFQGYLKLSRQDNLWPLLADILEHYPQISREWLYFGEGQMRKDQGGGAIAVEQAEEDFASKTARIMALEKEIPVLRCELARKEAARVALLEELVEQQRLNLELMQRANAGQPPRRPGRKAKKDGQKDTRGLREPVAAYTKKLQEQTAAYVPGSGKK